MRRRLASPWIEQIDGGRAEGHSPEDYDAEDLAKGTEVEYEHSDDKDVATEIAMDHLQEYDDYYEGLEAMENVLREREHEDWEDKLPGGLADEMDPEDFDPEALEDGVEVELEHTDDENVATEISMDHLSEFPEYYEALEDMEDELKGKKESAVAPETRGMTEQDRVIELMDYIANLPQWSRQLADLRKKFRLQRVTSPSVISGNFYRVIRDAARELYAVLSQTREDNPNSLNELLPPNEEFPNSLLSYVAELFAEEFLNENPDAFSYLRGSSMGKQKEAVAETPYVQDDKEAMGALVAAFNQLKGIADFAEEKSKAELAEKVKEVQELIRSLAREMKGKSAKKADRFGVEKDRRLISEAIRRRDIEALGKLVRKKIDYPSALADVFDGWESGNLWKYTDPTEEALWVTPEEAENISKEDNSLIADAPWKLIEEAWEHDQSQYHYLYND